MLFYAKRYVNILLFPLFVAYMWRKVAETTYVNLPLARNKLHLRVPFLVGSKKDVSLRENKKQFF